MVEDTLDVAPSGGRRKRALNRRKRAFFSLLYIDNSDSRAHVSKSMSKDHTISATKCLTFHTMSSPAITQCVYIYISFFVRQSTQDKLTKLLHQNPKPWPHPNAHALRSSLGPDPDAHPEPCTRLSDKASTSSSLR